MSPLGPPFSSPVSLSLSVLLLPLIGLKGACFLPVFCQAKLNISKQQQAPKEAPGGTPAEAKPDLQHAGP